jgi:hypothetical protein
VGAIGNAKAAVVGMRARLSMMISRRSITGILLQKRRRYFPTSAYTVEARREHIEALIFEPVFPLGEMAATGDGCNSAILASTA